MCVSRGSRGRNDACNVIKSACDCWGYPRIQVCAKYATDQCKRYDRCGENEMRDVILRHELRSEGKYQLWCRTRGEEGG